MLNPHLQRIDNLTMVIVGDTPHDTFNYFEKVRIFVLDHFPKSCISELFKPTWVSDLHENVTYFIRYVETERYSKEEFLETLDQLELMLTKLMLIPENRAVSFSYLYS